MTKEQIKKELSELYQTLNETFERIKEVQSNCPHEIETTELDGVTYKTCKICEAYVCEIPITH